jgi:hypothetical protein
VVHEELLVPLATIGQADVHILLEAAIPLAVQLLNQVPFVQAILV